MANFFSFLIEFFWQYWWFIFPFFILLPIWFEKYQNYKKRLFAQKFSWTFLELIFPSGMNRSPRNMEEVFNALHVIAPDPKKDLTWWNLNIKGFLPKNFCFMMIAHSTKLRFFIRVPKELTDFLKTRFYAFYPEIQFKEFDDPLSIFPPLVPNNFLEVESFNVNLNKEDGYPIRTYLDIEKLPSEFRFDPLATFAEGAHQISDKEWLVFQIFVLPIKGDDPLNGKNWIERGNKLVDKLLGKPEKKEIKFWQDLFKGILDTFKELFTPTKPVETKTEAPSQGKEFSQLTTGEKEVIEKIQKKISKLGFLSGIRVAYLAETKTFQEKSDGVFKLIDSVFKNFASENLNSFSLKKTTRKFKNEPSIKKWKMFLYNIMDISGLIKYKTPSDKFVLNSEELATIFHPPMEFVSPAGIERVSVEEIPPPPEIFLP